MQLISAKRNPLRILTCGVLAFLTNGPAQATTVLPLAAEEVRERSSAVVVATVSERRVWRDPDSGMIRTDLELAAVDVLWSDDGHFRPEHLTFSGGELDGRTMVVAGMPDFPVGVPAVFFVEGDGQSEACPTVGWTQGYFAVGENGLRSPSGEYLAVDDSGRLLRSEQPAHPLNIAELRSILAAAGGVK
jgi:hypothetical protein